MAIATVDDLGDDDLVDSPADRVPGRRLALHREGRCPAQGDRTRTPDARCRGRRRDRGPGRDDGRRLPARAGAPCRRPRRLRRPVGHARGRACGRRSYRTRRRRRRPGLPDASGARRSAVRRRGAGADQEHGAHAQRDAERRASDRERTRSARLPQCVRGRRRRNGDAGSRRPLLARQPEARADPRLRLGGAGRRPLPRPPRSQGSRGVDARVRRAAVPRHGDRGRAKPPPSHGSRGVARGHDLPQRRRSAGRAGAGRHVAQARRDPAAGERRPLPVARRAPAADRLSQRARHAGDGAVREPAGRDDARLSAVLVAGRPGLLQHDHPPGRSQPRLRGARTCAADRRGPQLRVPRDCERRLHGHGAPGGHGAHRRHRQALVRPGLHPRHLGRAPARGAAAAVAEARGRRPACRRRRARDQHADPVHRRQRAIHGRRRQGPDGADRDLPRGHLEALPAPPAPPRRRTTPTSSTCASGSRPRSSGWTTASSASPRSSAR